MILVKVSSYENDNFKEIVVSGHANSNVVNKDLICAGASSICFGAANMMNNYKNLKVSIKKNKFSFQNNSKLNNENQIMMKMLFLQLLTLSIDNEKYIKILKNESK